MPETGSGKNTCETNHRSCSNASPTYLTAFPSFTSSSSSSSSFSSSSSSLSPDPIPPPIALIAERVMGFSYELKEVHPHPLDFFLNTKELGFRNCNVCHVSLSKC